MASPAFISLLLFFFPSIKGFSQEYTADDAPGPLSPVHVDSPGLLACMKCHNEDFEVVPAKCLSCHREIAERVAAGRGFHRDKGEDCAACHVDHQGEDAPLIDWAPSEFDHEETGAELVGRHAEIRDCRACHRPDNTIPRDKTRSYLFAQSGCLACHASPHPGRQEHCLACHTAGSWRVDIRQKGENR